MESRRSKSKRNTIDRWLVREAPVLTPPPLVINEEASIEPANKEPLPISQPMKRPLDEDEDEHTNVKRTQSDNADPIPNADSNEYELQRLCNIEENNRLLAELGLASVASNVTKPPVKTPRRPPRQPFSSEFEVLRRSSPRLAGKEGVANYNEEGHSTKLRHRATVQQTEPPQLEFSELGQSISGLASYPMAMTTTPAATRWTLSGHRHNIYSQSFTNDGRFLAAAGVMGLVSIYQFPTVPLSETLLEQSSSPSSSSPSKSTQPASPASHATIPSSPLSPRQVSSSPSCLTPLAIFPVHKRWTADVQWVSHDLILTASDDATVVLSRLALDDKCSLTLVSRLSRELHSAGLFAMHELDRQVITASKDCTVGLTTITNDSLQVVRKFTKAGTSVVKTCRWQNSNSTAGLFACAGNDCLIRLFDVRSSSDDASVSFSKHTMAVNTVGFCPIDSFSLFSSSFDASICLWDIRNPSTVVGQLRGHHTGAKIPLLHPIYSADGKSIITPGHGSSCLFNYNVSSLSLSSVFDVGFSPQTIAVVPQSSLISVASGKNAIYVVDP